MSCFEESFLGSVSRSSFFGGSKSDLGPGAAFAPCSQWDEMWLQMELRPLHSAGEWAWGPTLAVLETFDLSSGPRVSQAE